MSERKHVKFAESLRAKQEKVAPDQINMAAAAGRTPEELARAETREPNTMDEQFPTDQLTQKDKRDKLMEAKLALSEGHPMGYTDFGKLEAKEEDFKWLMRKEAAAERANMELWFAKNFDYMSPAQKAYAKKIFPQFYEARKRLLRKQCDNLFDYARIKLDGIQDLDDAKLMYLIEQGRIDLGPLENILNPEGVNTSGAKKRNEARFQRGLANPFLVFGKMAEPMNYETRKLESARFAARSDVAENASIGIRDQGFPPFSGDESNQGTTDWYKALTQGMGRLRV